MRRITWWALSTISAVALLFGYHTSTSGATPTTGAPVASGSFSSSGSPTSAAPSATTSSGSGSGSGGSDDETVAGSVAQTRWGPVQVQLTIVGGKITKASVLQYPNNNGRDAEINDQALPILTRETVAAQSASIDMVSGATYTSNGYIQSLQSALDKAGL